jgi:spermidine synthase
MPEVPTRPDAAPAASSQAAPPHDSAALLAGVPAPDDPVTGARKPTGFRRLSAIEPYAVVFLASGITLILEILAARILAPHIGVSVYTWTSIIGVILAGISIGNWLGGVVADRRASRRTLGVVLLLGAAATVIIPVMANWTPDRVGSLPILVRIVLLTLTLFFVPATVLAMVSPIVIRLTLRDLSKTGSVAGRIYAISTAGAIAGTFLTGFVLVQSFGSRPTVYGLAAALVVLGVLAGRLWRPGAAGAAALVLLGCAGAFAASRDPLASLCQRESSYFCIRVVELERDGRQVRELVLDQLVHSYVVIEDPTHLEYGYQKVFSELIEAHTAVSPGFRALFIGGGGYELPRYLEALYPESVIEVIEIDPEVTAVAHAQLGLRPDTRVATVNEDARMSVAELPVGAYDIVVGDAFNDVSVPWHLTTREFNEQVKSLLRAGEGMYAVNVIDAPVPGTFLRAMVNTLLETWPRVYVLNQTGSLDFDQRSTTVVVATDLELDENYIRLRYAQARTGTPVTRIVPAVEVQAWLDSGNRVVLRDDFAPVDNYLAPLYLQSR